MSGRNLARWLARKPPKAAKALSLQLNGEPSSVWDLDDVSNDPEQIAREIHESAEAHATEIEGSVTVRVVWIGPNGRELTTHTYSVGVATGDARLDGSPVASAHNAQRHVEAMTRLMVSHTQTLARSWAELGEAQQRRALDAEREARTLREELRAKRDELEGRETEQPSAVSGFLEEHGPALLAAFAQSAAGAAAGSPAPPTDTEATKGGC